MKIHTIVDPLPLREKAYMDSGDQLDAIFKGFLSLQEKGFELPAETVEWIEHCKAVKCRHPKDKDTK
ncbi:hypothetical protein [Caballeronia sp. TF1N1]|uniref:hypothetical protein n=1 Tax=Caballeronia sp. TF1N1 TaxID=2878153 RepID=UPI001FD4D2AE|nr:hypothetical protein [Caballeronia sp. TF1N1]